MDRLQLVLWVAPDCGLCGQARELMSSLAAAMSFDWSDQTGEFGDSVPVVATADGRVLAEAPIVPSQLADSIRAITLQG